MRLRTDHRGGCLHVAYGDLLGLAGWEIIPSISLPLNLKEHLIHLLQCFLFFVSVTHVHFAGTLSHEMTKDKQTNTKLRTQDDRITAAPVGCGEERNKEEKVM